MAGPDLNRLRRCFGRALLGVLALTVAAAAQDQGTPNPAASTPVCLQLQGQLAAVDRGFANPANADQIKRAEDAIANQQAELDRTVAAAHKQGCAGGGFFALFSGLSPKCGAINSHIQEMRDSLDRMNSQIERLKSGNNDQIGQQRRVLIGQLAQNNCGGQYASSGSESESGPRGFLDALFGNGTVVNPNGDGAPSGTYQTVCVRTCDGYYFPISYSTVPDRFADDQKACQRLCPASEATLFTYHNPGESIDQAVSAAGQPYTTLPNAFRYRKQVTQGCSCRRPGQSWADALKNADDSTTLESGDIVVTDKNANALSQAPQQPAKPPVQAASDQPPASTDATDGKRHVRVVGPPFLSSSVPTANQR